MSTTTTYRIALAVLAAIDLALTVMIAVGVGRMRLDFEFWQTALSRIDERLRGYVLLDEVDKPLDEDGLARWLREHPDRPHKHDPP
jgi:hypothetical protein